MGFNRFGVLLTVRLFFILLVITLVSYLVLAPGYYAATLLGLIIIILLTSEVFRFVSKTNREVARFLDAVRYADFGQRFEFESLGLGFAELGNTFTHILDGFREDRKQQESELRHLKALLEHVPVPLISIYTNGQITLWNNSSRRLFGQTQVTRLSDLEQFGADFFKIICSIQAGERILASFHVDNMEQRLTIAASQITIASNNERLISLQNIKSELDGMQLSAWRDLVRVLTHEIMNSITPVASLAKTAEDLVDDVSAKVVDKAEIVEDLKDIKRAVGTVARRSDGLIKFVSSYRQLTRLPVLEKTRFPLNDLFVDVERVAVVDWPAKGLALNFHVERNELEVYADRLMLEQVLINLLKNCEHALENISNGQVNMSGKLNQRGHVTIEVSDNGPGIADEIASRIFIPFFTTRREGSGVGLALSRQTMIAHGGTITFNNNEQGGSRFTLVF